MLLIENGYMIDPRSGCEGYYDILIKDDRIIKIGKNLRNILTLQGITGHTIINAEGLLVLPGLVDIHVHFREPGFTHKEDIATGAKAAAKGGFTTVVMMANTKPAIDNETTLTLVLDKGKETGIHVKSCAGITAGLLGKELVPMEELAQKGAAGFTDDGVPLMDEDLVREAMKRAAALDLPLSFHEEDPDLITNNGINAGKASTHFGIGGSPREAEVIMIERDVNLALETGACINIQHISTKEGVELVRKAKKKGNRIHAEATPHHFTLTEEAVIRHGSQAKMNPPLREESDREAIIQGLIDGTIDLIATDHAPHSQEEKSLPLTQAPSGIIGLETALPLGITVLTGPGHLTMKELIEKMSTNPAAMYHLDAGYLAEGGPADIILVDETRSAEAGNYASKASNTPFTGQKLKGVVCKTICAGKLVYEEGVRLKRRKDIFSTS